jgi:hypothetical protein
LLLLLPASPEAALGPFTQRCVGGLLLKAAAAGLLLKVPPQLARVRRVNIGAFEPGQLKI